MSKIIDYVKTHKYALVVLYWPVHTLWYEIIRLRDAAGDVTFIHSPLDDAIPFIEWFSIPYCLWFPYIAAVLIYTLIKDKRDFLRASALVTACMFVPMVICTLFPNGLEPSMRPDFETLGRSNLGTLLTQFVYATDSPPRCVMPSMHCAVSVVLFAATLKSRSTRGMTAAKIASGALSLLIILATVFIKQHSILDLFAGVSFGLFAVAAVFAAEYLYDRKKRRKNEKNA